MFCVIRDLTNMLVCERQPCSAVALSVCNGALFFVQQVIPDLMNIGVVLRISVIKVMFPVSDWTVDRCHGGRFLVSMGNYS